MYMAVSYTHLMENCIRVLTEKKVDLLAASDLYKL